MEADVEACEQEAPEINVITGLGRQTHDASHVKNNPRKRKRPASAVGLVVDGPLCIIALIGAYGHHWDKLETCKSHSDLNEAAGELADHDDIVFDIPPVDDDGDYYYLYGIGVVQSYRCLLPDMLPTLGTMSPKVEEVFRAMKVALKAQRDRRVSRIGYVAVPFESVLFFHPALKLNQSLISVASSEIDAKFRASVPLDHMGTFYNANGSNSIASRFDGQQLSIADTFK